MFETIDCHLRSCSAGGSFDLTRSRSLQFQKTSALINGEPWDVNNFAIARNKGVRYASIDSLSATDVGATKWLWHDRERNPPLTGPIFCNSVRLGVSGIARPAPINPSDLWNEHSCAIARKSLPTLCLSTNYSEPFVFPSNSPGRSTKLTGVIPPIFERLVKVSKCLLLNRLRTFSQPRLLTRFSKLRCRCHVTWSRTEGSTVQVVLFKRDVPNEPSMGTVASQKCLLTWSWVKTKPHLIKLRKGCYVRPLGLARIPCQKTRVMSIPLSNSRQ